jgi:tetratricopeptide (TPR) repeat protein
MKRFLLVSILFVVPSIAYAGELLFPEALEHYNEAVKAQKAGNTDQAVAAYKMAALVVGADAFEFKKLIANNMGVIYAQRGEYEKAESSFTEALGIDPEYKKAGYNLGLLYFRQSDYVKALKIWSKMFGFPQEFSIEGAKNLEK